MFVVNDVAFVVNEIENSKNRWMVENLLRRNMERDPGIVRPTPFLFWQQPD